MSSSGRRLAHGVVMSFVLAAALGPAGALESVRTKRVFFAGDTPLPELAREYLRTHPGEAIRIDSFTRIVVKPVESFYGMGPVSRTEVGVCRFTTTPVFPRRSENGEVSWDGTPPAGRRPVPVRMGKIAAAPCPLQNDTSYTSLDGEVTDEEFVDVSAFWKMISASEEEFDRVAGLLPFILPPRATDKFTEFRDNLFRPDREPLQMRALWREGIETYAVGLSEPGVESPGSFLYLSKSLTGYQLLNFQTPY